MKNLLLSLRTNDLDEVVFANRNKSYGAYALRNDYSNQLTTGRAQSSLVPISSNTFLAYSDLYGSSRSTFNNVITLSLGISGKTLYRYIDTGSKIVITFSGVSTQRSNCQVWVQN